MRKQRTFSSSYSKCVHIVAFRKVYAMPEVFMEEVSLVSRSNVRGWQIFSTIINTIWQFFAEKICKISKKKKGVLQ